MRGRDVLVGGCVGKLVDTAACIFVKKEWSENSFVFESLRFSFSRKNIAVGAKNLNKTFNRWSH